MKNKGFTTSSGIPLVIWAGVMLLSTTSVWVSLRNNTLENPGIHLLLELIGLLILLLLINTYHCERIIARINDYHPTSEYQISFLIEKIINKDEVRIRRELKRSTARAYRSVVLLLTGIGFHLSLMSAIICGVLYVSTPLPHALSFVLRLLYLAILLAVFRRTFNIYCDLLNVLAEAVKITIRATEKQSK